MAKEIGWSNESNLLYQILKQLTKLTSVIFSLKPKYKVYTALLTQNGESNVQYIYNVPLTIGVTYFINNNNGSGDFTNVGSTSIIL